MGNNFEKAPHGEREGEREQERVGGEKCGHLLGSARAGRPVGSFALMVMMNGKEL